MTRKILKNWKKSIDNGSLQRRSEDKLMKYYDEELQTLQKQNTRKRHLQALLQELHTQRTELERKVNGLKTIMDKEQSDVDRLEGRGLRSLFYDIVGKKEEKLDEQRREAVTARAKYDVGVQEMELVVRRINRYEEELSAYKNVEMQYAYALKQKVRLLKDTATPVCEKILQLEEQISKLENQKKEIKEAIEAGTKARKIAEKVLSELDTAEGWGTWDLFGGGLISDLAKHSSLDEAQEEIEHLQVQLRRFKTELADVTIRAGMQVNVDGFLRFADYFFDGLFTDLAVLDKIEQSKAEVNDVIRQIQAVLDKLAAMLTEAESEQCEVQERLDNLVVQA